LKCIIELLKIDKSWIPNKKGFSLYIRPCGMSMEPTLGVKAPTSAKLFTALSPVGPYFPGGFKPMKFMSNPNYERGGPKSAAAYKVAGNYAPTNLVAK